MSKLTHLYFWHATGTLKMNFVEVLFRQKTLLFAKVNFQLVIVFV